MMLVREGRKELGLLELDGIAIQSYPGIDRVAHQSIVHPDGTLYLSPLYSLSISFILDLWCSLERKTMTMLL